MLPDAFPPSAARSLPTVFACLVLSNNQLDDNHDTDRKRSQEAQVMLAFTFSALSHMCTNHCCWFQPIDCNVTPVVLPPSTERWSQCCQMKQHAYQLSLQRQIAACGLSHCLGCRLSCLSSQPLFFGPQLGCLFTGMGTAGCFIAQH